PRASCSGGSNPSLAQHFSPRPGRRGLPGAEFHGKMFPISILRRIHDSPRTLAVALAAIAALALAACAPGSSGDSGADEETPPGDDGAAGPRTLTVWDQEVRGGQDEQMSRLNEAFEEEHGVEINRNSQSFDDLATTLRGALTGSEAPDVVQANNTRGDMGAFVSAGLLLDLSDYAAEYGWADRYDDAVLAMSSYS